MLQPCCVFGVCTYDRGMRTTTLDHALQSASDELLTTGEAARLLGVSRQHVVDLCQRGDLPYETAGVHRRVRRGDVETLRAQQGRPTRDQRRSLWLGALIAGKVVTDPEHAIRVAHENLTRMQAANPRGLTRRWLREWEHLVNGPVEQVLTTLLSPTPHARELRQNNPFAGLLTDSERQVVLDQFRATEHR